MSLVLVKEGCLFPGERGYGQVSVFTVVTSEINKRRQNGSLQCVKCASWSKVTQGPVCLLVTSRHHRRLGEGQPVTENTMNVLELNCTNSLLPAASINDVRSDAASLRREMANNVQN